MSGPKIVRVVTREEVLAICNAHLRRLERAVVSWESTLRQFGVVDEAASAAVANRFKALEALLRADKFSEVQKSVPLEISFLEGEEERQRIKAIEARAEMLRRSRQLKRNAVVLLENLKTRGVAVDVAMKSRLKKIASGSLLGSPAESSLGEAFRMLAAPAAPTALTSSQRGIAARLMSGNEAQDFAKWQAASAILLETRAGSLEKRLAELSTFLGEAEVKQFSDRLSTIDDTEEDASRNLRIDSLVLDVSAAVLQARQNAVLIREGNEVLAELALRQEAAASNLATVRSRLTDALAKREVSSLHKLVEEGRAALAAAAAKQAADARRTAVLAGLQGLGYDVREGMSTAWEQKGRVVLRKLSQADYGVEISSAASGERMQVRAVAFSANRDLSRDSDVETAWCGDFGKLQSMLASQGGGIDIERSHAIGAMHLKAVDLGEVGAYVIVAPLARR